MNGPEDGSDDSCVRLRSRDVRVSYLKPEVTKGRAARFCIAVGSDLFCLLYSVSLSKPEVSFSIMGVSH
jgi:hypothetical protein